MFISTQSPIQTKNSHPKPTVLFIADEYAYNGVASCIQQYIRMCQAEYSTVVLCFKANSHDKKLFSSNFTYIVSEEISTGARGKFHNLYLWLKYLHIIYSKHNVSIVHLNLSWSSLFTLLHPWTYKKKLIGSFHGAFFLERASQNTQSTKFSLIEKVKKLFRKQLQRMYLFRSEKIITYSDYSAGLLRDHFKIEEPKITIIPGCTGVKPLIYNPSLNKVRILNYGRIEPRKGITELLTSLSLLKKKKINFSASIASPIEYFFYYPEVLKLYEEYNLFTSIHFLHKINSKQKLELFKNTDLFIMPSLDLETFGFTIIESLSYGVPVIGYPTGAIPEILSKVDRDLICKQPSPTCLAEKVEWFSKLSKKEKMILAHKSQGAVQKYFNDEKYAHKLLGCYN